MPSVRLSLFEDPLEVHDSEVPVLRSQGLLREVDGVPEPGHEPSEPDDKKER